MAGFNAMARGALKPGALSESHKELIALAIGVAGHCDGCIGFHAKSLVRLGAKREEVMEALAVAVYMGGGPSLMYAAEAVHAFDEFAAVPPAPSAVS
jgi:AhpD family alkylhydroperoxidase